MKKIIAFIVVICMLSVAALPMTAQAASTEDLVEYFNNMPIANNVELKNIADQMVAAYSSTITEAQCDAIMVQYIRVNEALAETPGAFESKNDKKLRSADFTASQKAVILDAIEKCCEILNWKFDFKSALGTNKPFKLTIIDSNGKVVVMMEGEVKPTGETDYSSYIYLAIGLVAVVGAVVFANKKVFSKSK